MTYVNGFGWVALLVLLALWIPLVCAGLVVARETAPASKR